jgi:hypothetical protein
MSRIVKGKRERRERALMRDKDLTDTMSSHTHTNIQVAVKSGRTDTRGHTYLQVPLLAVIFMKPLQPFIDMAQAFPVSDLTRTHSHLSHFYISQAPAIYLSPATLHVSLKPVFRFLVLASACLVRMQPRFPSLQNGTSQHSKAKSERAQVHSTSSK